MSNHYHGIIKKMFDLYVDEIAYPLLNTQQATNASLEILSGTLTESELELFKDVINAK